MSAFYGGPGGAWGREERQEQQRQEARQRIVDKYYKDPDADMRGLGSSMLHNKFVGEYEPSASQKREMELELQLFDLTYKPDDD